MTPAGTIDLNSLEHRRVRRHLRKRWSMVILLIEYRVADHGRWKAVFDQDPIGRGAHGVTRHWIYQSTDDPNHLMVSLEFSSAEQAKAFRSALQPVWGVSGAQQAWILREADADLTVGGANLATQAFKAGLVDECQLLVWPMLVGGGKPGLPTGIRANLELLDERRFGNGVVHLRYRPLGQ